MLSWLYCHGWTIAALWLAAACIVGPAVGHFLAGVRQEDETKADNTGTDLARGITR